MVSAKYKRYLCGGGSGTSVVGPAPPISIPTVWVSKHRSKRVETASTKAEWELSSVPVAVAVVVPVTAVIPVIVVVPIVVIVPLVLALRRSGCRRGGVSAVDVEVLLVISYRGIGVSAVEVVVRVVVCVVEIILVSIVEVVVISVVEVIVISVVEVIVAGVRRGRSDIAGVVAVVAWL